MALTHAGRLSTLARMKHDQRILAMAALVGLSPACKQGDEPRAELFADVCTRMFACDCREYPYKDLSECQDRQAIEFAGLAASAEAAGLAVDTDCLLSRFTVSQFECRTGSDVYGGEDDPACWYCSVVHGDVALAQPCTEYEAFDDCAAGLVCSHGLCVDPCAPLQIGDPCDASGDSWLAHCDEGLQCDGETDRCVALPRVGEACDGHCADGLYCDDDDVCRRQPGNGDPCPDYNCAEGLGCNFDAEAGEDVCRPVVGVGQPCDARECADELDCVTDPVTLEETCQPDPGPGEPCRWGFCARGAYCDDLTDVCKAMPGLGEACVDRYPGCADKLECSEDSVCEPESPLVCDG